MLRNNKGPPVSGTAATECSAAPPIEQLLRVPLPVRRRRRPENVATAFGVRLPSSPATPASTAAAAAAGAGEDAASLLVHCGDGVVDTVVYTCGFRPVGRHRQAPRGLARRDGELGTRWRAAAAYPLRQQTGEYEPPGSGRFDAVGRFLMTYASHQASDALAGGAELRPPRRPSLSGADCRAFQLEVGPGAEWRVVLAPGVHGVAALCACADELARTVYRGSDLARALYDAVVAAVVLPTTRRPDRHGAETVGRQAASSTTAAVTSSAAHLARCGAAEERGRAYSLLVPLRRPEVNAHGPVVCYKRARKPPPARQVPRSEARPKGETRGDTHAYAVQRQHGARGGTTAFQDRKWLSLLLHDPASSHKRGVRIPHWHTEQTTYGSASHPPAPPPPPKRRRLVDDAWLDNRRAYRAVGVDDAEGAAGDAASVATSAAACGGGEGRDGALEACLFCGMSFARLMRCGISRGPGGARTLCMPCNSLHLRGVLF